jgi:hypothetical protein
MIDRRVHGSGIIIIEMANQQRPEDMDNDKGLNRL